MKKISLLIAVMISFTLSACAAPAQPPSQPAPQNSGAPQAKVSVEGLWSEDDPVLGDANAPIAIVVYSDFQCPYCAEFLDTLDRLQNDWIETGKVKIQYRDFPLSIHFNSVPAHLAANAAAKQGKYLEMHHLLFEKQKEWESATNPKKFFSDYAAELGLDVPQFESDAADQSLMTEIQGDKEAGRIAGVSGTPGFYVNGMYYDGAVSYENLIKILQKTESTL